MLAMALKFPLRLLLLLVSDMSMGLLDLADESECGWAKSMAEKDRLMPFLLAVPPLPLVETFGPFGGFKSVHFSISMLSGIMSVFIWFAVQRRNCKGEKEILDTSSEDDSHLHLYAYIVYYFHVGISQRCDVYLVVERGAVLPVVQQTHGSVHASSDTLTQSGDVLAVAFRPFDVGKQQGYLSGCAVATPG
jgi:hypothetical protein